MSPTYKKVDGYAPFFAYLGQEGYGINVNLREGSMHVQKEAAAFLSHSLDYARRITDSPLLVRMDAGNDAFDLPKVRHDLLSKIHQDPKVCIDVGPQFRLAVFPIAHQVGDYLGVFIIVLRWRVVLELFAFVDMMRIN
ncbi:Uncharacterised protein [Paenibacillus thiaminolyticus]|nr:Uncharacterised protein [Paenibacillus thiaminolyticus]